MTLESLLLFNFRNLENTTIRFSDGLNIIQGENGQGKTNLMEAIYLLGTTKSFRHCRLGDLKAEGNSACSLKGSVERDGRQIEIFFRVEESGGKVYGRADSAQDLYDYIGLLDILAFTGEHLSIVRGGPEERRKFIDRGIVGLRSSYLKTVVEYRRAIRQKNRFLADSARGFAGKSGGFLIELEAWNERIIDLGSRILLERAHHVSRLNDLLQEIHSGLFSSVRPPVAAEAFYINMRWASAPARGERYIVYNGLTGEAVVGAAGYENGPGDTSRIGGACEEIHDHLGTAHLSVLTFGVASDQTADFGPITCTE